RPSKIIDVCNVCMAGNQYKVKLDSMVGSRNIDILSMDGIKLLASPICPEDLASYNSVSYKEIKINDKRSNMYALDHIQRGISGDALMGPSSIRI
ncbi:hypothetical protein BB560_004242, partial [Smittium megazygosporum]